MITAIRSLVLSACATLIAFNGFGLPAAHAFPARGVSDGGDFFDESHEQQTTRRIDQLHSKFGKDVRVETFAKVPDDHTARLNELGADSFFKDWLKERAKAEHVDGVFILVCRQPAMIKVGINESTRKTLFTEGDREALWKLMKRRFDQKDFNAGLTAGIDYIQDRFAAHSGSQMAPTNRGQSSAPARPHPLPNGGAPAQPQGAGFGRILMFAAIVFVGFLLLRGLFRSFAGGGASSGYGTGYPTAGGGGWGSSFLSGLFGAAVGNMLYDSFFRGHSSPFAGSNWDNSASAGESRDSFDNGASPDDWSVNEGGSFGDSSSNDFGGGGDFGGGDFGGGGSDY